MQRNRNGQGLVEIALVLPIFLVVVMGIFDFGRALHCWSNLNFQCIQAARLGSRRINQLVAPNYFLSTTHPSKQEVLEAFWKAKSPMMDKENFNLAFNSSNEPKVDGAGELNVRTVEIKATYDMELITPMLSTILGGEGKSGAVTLSASAIEQKE